MKLKGRKSTVWAVVEYEVVDEGERHQPKEDARILWLENAIDIVKMLSWKIILYNFHKKYHTKQQHR